MKPKDLIALLKKSTIQFSVPEPDESIPQSLFTVRYILNLSLHLPGKDKYFSLFRRVQTGSGAHPASYQMGTGGSFSLSKVAGL
jgi:hypothetical protein